jgi:MarR family transcriptional regulator, organic hydroperoxide resistance regulator
MTASAKLRTGGGRKRPEAAAPRADEEQEVDLGEGLTFMRLLWGVNHALEASSKRMDAAIGVTGPQRLVIRIVGRFPGISAGRLARLMHVHPSTLTGILGRLATRGLVRRDPDPNDARRALFSLTAKGRELDSLRAGTVETKVRTTLARFPDARVTATQAVLAAISEALAEPAPKPREAAQARRSR